MSGGKIPTRIVEGDVSVGRHITMGGNACVRGSVNVGHSLRVEGWLEARNLKGVCKGLFASAESLRAAYPEPMPGWWAIVGSTVPGPVWRAEDRGSGTVWAATGETGGQASLDSDFYNGALEDIQGEVGEVSVGLDVLSGRVDGVEDRVTGIEGLRGKPNGYAPLNGNGEVARTYLPYFAVRFEGFVTMGYDKAIETTADFTAPKDSKVMFNRANGCFVLVTASGEGYYKQWSKMTRWGYFNGNAATPHVGTIYFDKDGIYALDNGSFRQLVTGGNGSGGGTVEWNPTYLSSTEAENLINTIFT